MTLNDWLRNGWLQEHRTSPQEIANLFGVAERDLADSSVSAVSADGRLNSAYNAALQIATIALAASGFRAQRENHHYRTIQSLELTIGADPARVRRLDAFRKKRNVDFYERAGAISDGEVQELRAFATQLREDVLRWLKTHHRDLVPRQGTG